MDSRLQRVYGRPVEEAVQLRDAAVDLGLLLGPELLDARHLGLDAENGRLGARPHRVAGARDALDLLPALILLSGATQVPTRELGTVVKALHLRHEREP